MRRRNSKAVVVALVALAVAAAGAPARSQSSGVSAPPAQAPPSPSAPTGKLVVLDHVVAVINGDVILESDVQEEMRFTVLQPYRADPARNTAASALQRLIDRDLILQQMKATNANTTPPAPQQVEQQLLDLRKQIPECAEDHCQTEAGWKAFIAEHGLTEPEIEAHWRERMLILSFIQSRFGAGVRIAQPEIQEYYEKTLTPQFAGKNLKPPPLESVSSRIAEVLLQQRVNVFLRDWLESLKSEGSVSILGAAYMGDGSPSSLDEEGGEKP